MRVCDRRDSEQRGTIAMVTSSTSMALHCVRHLAQLFIRRAAAYHVIIRQMYNDSSLETGRAIFLGLRSHLRHDRSPNTVSRRSWLLYRISGVHKAELSANQESITLGSLSNVICLDLYLFWWSQTRVSAVDCRVINEKTDCFRLWQSRHEEDQVICANDLWDSIVEMLYVYGVSGIVIISDIMFVNFVVTS